MKHVSFLGAGSWGTALALLLHKNGHQVTVWSISEEEVEMLSTKREHVSKLPGVKIPEDMAFTSDLEAAVKGRDFIVLAVPHGSEDEPLYSGEADHCGCCKGNRGGHSDDPVTADRAGDSAGRCSGIVRAKPCRRGRTRTSNQCGYRCKDKKDGGISAEYVYE